MAWEQEGKLKEDARLQSSQNHYYHSTQPASVPPLDSTFACFLLPACALHWVVFQPLCLVYRRGVAAQGHAFWAYGCWPQLAPNDNPPPPRVCEQWPGWDKQLNNLF